MAVLVIKERDGERVREFDVRGFRSSRVWEELCVTPEPLNIEPPNPFPLPHFPQNQLNRLIQLWIFVFQAVFEGIFHVNIWFYASDFQVSSVQGITTPGR